MVNFIREQAFDQPSTLLQHRENPDPIAEATSSVKDENVGTLPRRVEATIVDQMKMKARRRDKSIITISALFTALGLVVVNEIWPRLFVVVIAFVGVLGAFLVIYEVQTTKRLAEAEFVHSLQTTFTSDVSIGVIWRKLLLQDRILELDRPLVSSYLTFFETLYLMIERGILSFSIADDLFRNRFFMAIGNDDVLKIALLRHAGSFQNIHSLIREWHHYLLSHELPIPLGYYSYIQGVLEAKGFQFKRLNIKDLSDLIDLQSRVLASPEISQLLRNNSDEMLEECLSKHITVGARFNDQLIAAAILYDGKLGEENIGKYISDDAQYLDGIINLKLVLTIQEYRRQGIGRSLIELLELEAVRLGKSEILCTVRGNNHPSQRLFKLLGYGRISSASTSYGRREIFARSLPSLNHRWAR